jgi:calcineurin-like phosphoesterase family protein
MIYFTSDLHFNHKNILKFTKRPYKNVEDMNNDIIKIWNNIIKKTDIVYILGDFCFCGRQLKREFLKRLNGKKILIIGNHDDFSARKQIEDGFYDVYLQKTIWLGKGKKEFKVNLSHYPYNLTKWEIFKRKLLGKHIDDRCKQYRLSKCDEILLCGHVHNAWKIKDNMINCGWDIWNRPISILEVLDFIKKEM